MNTTFKSRLNISILFILFVCSAEAQLRLANFFSDNMVLQQQTKAAIWGWAGANKNVSVTTSWNKKKVSTKANNEGKWKLLVETPAAGGPYEITVSESSTITIKNVLVGEVWLCSGQSNMEMPMKGYKDQPVLHSNDDILHSTNSQVRLYIVPRSVKAIAQQESKPSEWKEAQPESVANFSATAYYFGRLLNEMLHVPIGLVNISYGGSPAEAWMSNDSIKAFPEIKVPPVQDSLKMNNRTATTLFNGMLNPFIGYSIKGAIWYQGESNYDRPDQYENLFPAMVREWRARWAQGDFPFYFTQIAPFNYAPLPTSNTGGKYNSANLRDAQRKSVAKIPNSEMAVLLDAGEETSIHPANKQKAGERLALLSLANTYGMKGFAAMSPSLDSLIIKGSVATLKFKNAPMGLTSFGKRLSNFEIAGTDKIFRPAQAIISGGTVLVSAPNVREPVAVRYAFRDYVEGDLFSVEGLPVSSFRTDDW